MISLIHVKYSYKINKLYFKIKETLKVFLRKSFLIIKKLELNFTAVAATTSFLLLKSCMHLGRELFLCCVKKGENFFVFTKHHFRESM